MDIRNIEKKWLEFYEHDSNFKERLINTFKHWNINQSTFMQFPSVTNEGIVFGDFIGYAQANEYVISLICAKLSTLLKDNNNLLICFDQLIESNIKSKVIKIFKQQGHNVYGFAPEQKISEAIIREAFKIDILDGGLYFKYDKLTNKPIIKLYDKDGKMQNYQKVIKLVSDLYLFEYPLYYHANDDITQLSYNKIVDLYFNNKQNNTIFKINKHDKKINAKIIAHVDNQNSLLPFEKNITKNSFSLSYSKKLNFWVNKIKFLAAIKNKNNYDVIIFIDSKQNVDFFVKNTNKFKKIKSDLFAAIYLDYIYQNWKNENQTNKSVFVALNASNFIKNEINNLSLQLTYENQNINEEDIIFKYDNNIFTSGIKNNMSDDLLDFINYSTLLLQNYKNNNNLISLKIKEKEKRQKDFLSKNFNFKIPPQKLEGIFKMFSVNSYFSNENIITQVNIHKYKNNKYLFLLSLEINKQHWLHFYYSPKKHIISVDLNYNKDHNKKNINNFIEFIKLYFAISKVIKNLKK
ncbi:hypothetical protein V2E24_01765 [Mycoplasmopsis ciconiae]|uniref:Uncharacterized protein n=1 Tax=Mycoplasmopsis ciconiae TaxID=561067 RepID=A0ABU7MLI4_9BACT|nr:hypothetical protein [Mycoplasmopsis ciconiae]